MRYARFAIERISLDHEDIPLAFGRLLAVRRSGATSTEWEAMVRPIEATVIDPGVHPIGLVLLPEEGLSTRVRWSGEGFWVRSQDGLSVLRGTDDFGELLAVTPGDR